jgi:hypothetical protein
MAKADDFLWLCFKKRGRRRGKNPTLQPSLLAWSSASSFTISHSGRVNERYLGLTLPKLTMLLNWEKAPEQIAKQVINFEKRMNELKSSAINPRDAIKLLLQDLREAARNAQKIPPSKLRSNS